jgi:hypothetical protein
MDVWQLVARDHENITQLIHETPNALNSPGVVRSRERFLADLMDELETHAAAVDASLYAPLSRESGTRQLVEELRREHREFMPQLGTLTRYAVKNSVGWLNLFEDATTLVDQHLYRHSTELIPAARELLGPEGVRDATRKYVRARMRALQTRRRDTLDGLASSEVAFTATICAAAVGLGLIAWRRGWLRGFRSDHRPTRRVDEGWGQARGALAEPSALGPSNTRNDPQPRRGESAYSAMFRRVAGQNQGVPTHPDGDAGTAESDVLYRADRPRAALGEMVLPALREANEAWAGHGFQVYLKDETLTEAHDQPSAQPRILFRIARATLPEDLVARKAHLFTFASAEAENGVRFSIRAPGSAEDAQPSSHNADLQSDGELTSERMQGILERALRLAISDSP